MYEYHSWLYAYIRVRSIRMRAARTSRRLMRYRIITMSIEVVRDRTTRISKYQS